MYFRYPIAISIEHVQHSLKKKPNKPLRDFGFSNVDVAFLGHNPLLQALVVRFHAQELFA